MNRKTKDDKTFWNAKFSIKHDRFLFNFLFSSSSSSSTILSRLYTVCICLILELFCVESTNKIVHFLFLAVELLSNLQQHFKNKRFRCSASFSFQILLFFFVFTFFYFYSMLVVLARFPFISLTPFLLLLNSLFVEFQLNTIFYILFLFSKSSFLVRISFY